MAQYFGVRKCTIIKILKSGVELNKLDIGDIIEEGTVFMTACYGVKRLAKMSMSEVRGEFWT
jgi:hypothetical protein